MITLNIPNILNVSFQGFTNAILGPTVVSLLSVTNSPISYINWIFILQGLGFIFGILAAAMLARVVIAPVILSASIFFASFVNAALPWMRSFPALSGFIFTQFLLKGIVDYGEISVLTFSGFVVSKICVFIYRICLF